MQVWKSLGIIFNLKDAKLSWAKSHSMLPTVYKIKKNKIRVFFGSRNIKNISSIGYVDLEYNNEKFKILKYSRKPVLKPGLLGCFDDNGVLPSSIIKKKPYYYLFYIGWRPSVTTRYSLISGLSKSKSLNKFKRISKSSLLKTNNKEPYEILTAPCVLKYKNFYFMWYVSCNKWANKDFPIYDIKYAKSKDLENWHQTGITCIKLKKNERAVARPYVVYEKKIFKMWYSYEEKTKGYKIGYAESNDGINWIRKDKMIKFVNKFSEENKMQEYPNVVNFNGDKLMFYNGNYYGKNGIFCAKLKVKVKKK